MCMGWKLSRICNIVKEICYNFVAKDLLPMMNASPYIEIHVL